MGFLQKASDCIFHLTVAIVPSSSEPAAYSQSLLRDYGGLTQHGCQTAPTSDCFRVCQAPL